MANTIPLPVPTRWGDEASLRRWRSRRAAQVATGAGLAPEAVKAEALAGALADPREFATWWQQETASMGTFLQWLATRSVSL